MFGIVARLMTKNAKPPTVQKEVNKVLLTARRIPVWNSH